MVSVTRIWPVISRAVRSFFSSAELHAWLAVMLAQLWGGGLDNRHSFSLLYWLKLGLKPPAISGTSQCCCCCCCTCMAIYTSEALMRLNAKAENHIWSFVLPFFRRLSVINPAAKSTFFDLKQRGLVDIGWYTQLHNRCLFSQDRCHVAELHHHHFYSTLSLICRLAHCYFLIRCFL